MKRHRMSRHGSKVHKQRMTIVPAKLVPKPYEMMPDKEFVLKQKSADGTAYLYESPSTGNAVSIAETSTMYEGKNLWVVKNLAMMGGNRYLIANEGLFTDKETAFRNWVTPGFSDEQVPEDVIVKLANVKTYKVKVERNEYSEGKVVGKDVSEVTVFAKSPADARKRGVESVSHGQKALEVKEIPYEQAKKEGEIY